METGGLLLWGGKEREGKQSGKENKRIRGKQSFDRDKVGRSEEKGKKMGEKK